MADITEINTQLWTGGAIVTDADVGQLVADGITADIDCRLEYDDESLLEGYSALPNTPNALKNHTSIAYLYDGVADDGVPKPVSWFTAAWIFAQPILKNGGVILAHCAAGHNRGPSMAYFLLRAYWTMPGPAAFALIQQKRPVASMVYSADADAAILELGLA